MLTLQNTLNQEAITIALVSLITIRRLLFRIVKWLEFYVFYRVLNLEVKCNRLPDLAYCPVSLASALPSHVSDMIEMTYRLRS